MKTLFASPFAFQKSLQKVFKAQAVDFLKTYTIDDIMKKKKVSLKHWLESMKETSFPFVYYQFQKGMKQQIKKLSIKTKSPLLVKQNRYVKIKDVDAEFDLSNEFVIQAVDELALSFCDETLKTLQVSLQDGLKELRDILKLGVTQGQSVELLKQLAINVFNDPYRARRIVVTETYRSLNTGELMVAKDSGIAEQKEWLASADACERCLELNNKIVDIDQYFHKAEKVGPYQLTYVPPLHPFCMCTWSVVF